MMKKLLSSLLFSCLIANVALAADNSNNTTIPASAIVTLQTPSLMTNSDLVPPAPELDAASYIVLDVNSGKILAQKNMNQERQPASLTKLMTLYLVFRAIENGTIHLDDEVLISHKAWKMGGSKMFVKVGTRVKVQDLIQGIIVDSGNDATVALAEFIGGNETSFVNMMNQQAKELGMNQTHFMDSTGLPNSQHITTAYDLSILARALIINFPKEYPYFGQKWLTYNGIKQPNRNRLLWRMPGADGMKTGDTDQAGYCLIGSAMQNNMRLLSVVMGTPSDEARATDSIALLHYGFLYFETHELYAANAPISQLRVWNGETKTIPVGVITPLYITVPRNQFGKIQTNIHMESDAQAPIIQNQSVGSIEVTLGGNPVLNEPLLALQADPSGGTWRHSADAVEHKVSGWFGKSTSK